MSMEYIRRTYGVPAKRGALVEFTNGSYCLAAAIARSDGHYIWLRDAAGRITGPYHPTWGMKYLDGDASREETSQ